MTSLEARFAEDVALRRLEARRKWNPRIALICMVFAAAFAVVDWQLMVTTQLQQGAYWVLVIVFSLIPATFAGIAAMAWYFVHRDRKRLEQLRAAVSAMAGRTNPGVWPPPPSVPKE